MKLIGALTLFLTLFTSAFACEQGEIAFSTNNICAQINWINGPSLNEFNSASIVLKNSNSERLNVIPWMVMDHGHEHGSRPNIITQISPTDYLVEKIYFMGGMKGDWFLRLQLVNDNKVVIEEQRVKIEF